VVFVTGDPGIGKTALTDAFLAEIAAPKGAPIARGSCVERSARARHISPSWLVSEQHAVGGWDVLRAIRAGNVTGTKTAIVLAVTPEMGAGMAVRNPGLLDQTVAAEDLVRAGRSIRCVAGPMPSERRDGGDRVTSAEIKK
jgi:hypothetical protein